MKKKTARPEALPLTSKMSRTARSRPHLVRPKNGLQTHKFDSKRKYPIHCNNLYMDVTRATSTSVGVMLENSIDCYWNVDGTETCQIRGQALLGSRYWMKNHRMDIRKRPPGQTPYWERHVRSVEAKRKANVGNRKTEA